MNSFPECEQFHDHRRTICRGERPDLSRATADQYRAAWGLSALPDHVPYPGSAAPTAPPSAPPSLPALAQRVATFAAALTDHVCDGMVKCEQSEIQARLEVCQQCPSFTGTHCRECGCVCNGQTTFFNKLAWRSEKCPLGRW